MAFLARWVAGEIRRDTYFCLTALLFSASKMCVGPLSRVLLGNLDSRKNFISERLKSLTGKIQKVWCVALQLWSFTDRFVIEAIQILCIVNMCNHLICILVNVLSFKLQFFYSKPDFKVFCFIFRVKVCFWHSP